MLFDTDDNYVALELTGEDGVPILYELLDIVEYEGVAYGRLSAGRRRLRRGGHSASGGQRMPRRQEGYVPVNDENLEQAVFDIFQIKNMDAFDFGGNSFQTNDLL